jgi:hypothetical protein
MPKILDISFNKASERLFSYLGSLYQPGEQFPYPLQKGQRGSLLGSVFSTYVASMLNMVDELPGKQEIAETLLRLRNSNTGLFSDPDISGEDFLNPANHTELYVSLQTTSFAYACLEALGIDVDRRIPWLEPLLLKGKLRNWLDALDWSNPWLVSNLDMFVGNFLLSWQQFWPSDEKVAEAVEEYFLWHDQNQHSKTGFWGDQKDLFNAMAGGYHIFIHYDYERRTINHINNIIDCTLDLVCRDGLFVYGGGGGSCEDMDAIDILIRCSLRTDYRENDIKKVLLNSALMLNSGQLADGGYSWRIQPCLEDLCNFSHGSDFIYKKSFNLLYKARHRSHYLSEHYYSSLKPYPFKLNKSDTWSSWFRPLALAFIARRYPESFKEPCLWTPPYWPGLGFDPFVIVEK